MPLKKNTHSIEVQPSYVGRNQKGHVEALLERAINEAKRKISYTYKVYTYMRFPNQQGGDDFEVRSNTYAKADAYRMLGDVVSKAKDLLQSDHEVKLKDFRVSFQFLKIPAGGAWSVSRERSDILKKKSVNTVTNNDNNCFWYALTMQVHSTHKDIKCIKMGRKIRAKLAKELCTQCGFEWDKVVSFEDIHTVELKLQVRILILGMEKIPILHKTSSIYNSLMYINTNHKFTATYWLLHDIDHYHSINNIKGFLAIEYFCSECLHGFHIKKSFEEHLASRLCCEDVGTAFHMNRRRKIVQNKSKRIGKDLAHYLHKEAMKGGQDEVEKKLQQEIDKLKEDEDSDYDNDVYIENRREALTNRVEEHRYIIYDFEADVHTLTHHPNHVEADVLQVDKKQHV